MSHQNLFLRLMAALLLVAMLVGMLPASISAAESTQRTPATRAAETETAQDRMYYDSWSLVPDYDGCTSMQGMAVLGDYIYTLKKNSTDNKAAIFRTSRFGTETVQMNFDGAMTADYLGHGNDMCAAQVGSDAYLFVATMKESVGALVCFKISGTKLTKVGIFNVYTSGGSKITPTGVDTYKVEGNKVTLLIANSLLIFMGTFDVTAPASEIRCPLGFEIDSASLLETARAACGMPNLEMTIQGSGYYNDTYYMPLTMHHNHSTQIKVDNHADSASVIVALPNIAEAIAQTKRDVKASLSETINLPDAGFLFFEVESVDFADGITYINTNRVRIDQALSYVSVLLDPDVDTELLTKRAAFRNDGLYKVSGTVATDYFMYDPGASDGHLEAGQYTDSVNIYFGFESNEQGFYYIRSMRSKQYLTVNADGTVTQSEKKENDPSQLFCLTQIDSPDNLGKVAIISMLNFQYLNNADDSAHTVVTTTAGKAHILHEVRDTTRLESYLFDINLYKKCYPDVCAGKTDAQIKEYYNTTGKALGHVASIYFDPEYYLKQNPDVAASATYGTPQGAYTHFVKHGFWEGRQGSLYFCLNEYLHQEGNDALKTGDYPDKLYYLNHFKVYGVNESLTRPERNGSDEFQVKELVAKYALSPTSGYDFIVDCISRGVRLKAVEALKNASAANREAALKKLLFDWEYYSSKYSAALSEDKLAGFAGNTYAEKLLTHWEKYGIQEGRNASPLFSATYYRTMYPDCTTITNPTTEAEKKQANQEAYNHFVTVGFWEGRSGSPYYDGEVYISTMERTSENCPHLHTVTMTKASTCTVNGTQSLCCAACRTVLKTKKLPLADHVDADQDKTCDICGSNLSGNAVLKGSVANLVEPGPVNEYYDLTGVTFADQMYDGFYYMVQKNSDGKYRVFDTLNQTIRGSFAATEVTAKDGAIYGAHPDMAVELKLVSAGSNGKEGTYNIKVNGPYYLGYGNNSVTGTYGEARRMTSVFNMSLRVLYDVEGYTDRFRIWRAIADTANGVASTAHWLGMHDNDGFNYYRFTTDVYADDENTFYLYKLLFDRLHTEDMYATLKEAAAYIDPNVYYDAEKHEQFLYCLKECVDLYNKYNGNILKGDDLTNREALQEAMDAKMHELINLMGYLKINAEGKTIRYFPANMYNYNEDNMNALVNVMPGADTKGFFFESANNKNTTAFYSVYDSTTSEQVKGRTVRSQMYSISSGIAASDLSTATNPPFANSVVTADFWSETPIANTKEVYTDIGVPFVYDDGYYILNSDSNAVFFEDEPASGADLAILEKPATYYWSGGMTHGVAKPSYVEKDYTTHHYADGYVTGFQPFAKMSNRRAEAYTAEASVFEESELVEGYLLDGVAFNSAVNPTPAVSNSGTAVWGFGMKLDVEFMMTDDGRLVDENNTPITFEFSGDDDVWVFIDGKLVLDIGGSHDAIQGVIDFTDGSVTVRSDKYDRIRDKNTSGYGWSDTARYEASQLSSVHAITTNAMHQKNIYSEVFKQSIEQFANNGESHTLTVYYMDRGKGRTNSTIKFNLPQTDTLTVKKNIKCADYENGELVTMSAEKAAPLMEKLSEMKFSFVLTDDGNAVANQTYTLIDNGINMGEKTTNASGSFTLLHGQSAIFYGLNFTASNKYKVVETTPLKTWFDVSWSHTTTGNGTVTATAPTSSQTTYNANTSSTVSISGDLYANETLTFNCTNTFVNVPLENDQVIVDYGKSVEIDIFENDPQLLYAHYYIRTLQGFLPYDEDLDLVASRKLGGGSTLVTENGNYSIVDGKVHFEPKKMLEEVEKVWCVVKYTKGTDFFYLYEELQIVPSNIMYYETDFADGVRDLPKVNNYVLMDFGPDDTTEWKSVSGITVTKDTANGVLHGEINATSTPWMGMNYHTDQLDYVVKPGDVINIRLKVKVTSASSYTGIQFFMATDDYPYYKEETSVKNSSEKSHVSNDYVVLQYPVNPMLVGQKLTEFRLDPFDGATNVKGTVDIDYIYIGPERHDDFLYFGFDNTDADRLRYSQAQYGGYNYDAEHWCARTYTMNAPTFENDEGALRITTLSNPDPQYGFSYYYQVSGSVPNYFDLQYNPANAEVLRVRMKLENFVPNGTPGVSINYYLNDKANYNPNDGKDDEIYSLTNRPDIDPAYLESGEYFTVEIPATELQRHERISTIRICINGVKDVERGAGIVTVDYVYVGPAATAPSEDYLFFDFGNTAADQIRYDQPHYGNVNFDKGNWVLGTAESTTAYTIDNNAGTLTLNLSSNPDHNGPYVSVTNGSSTNYPWSGNKSLGILNFDATKVDMMMVRFKITGATKIKDEELRVRTVSHLLRSGTELYYGDIGENSTYPFIEDEWITVRVDVGNNYRDGDILQTIGLWLPNIESTTGGQVVIDYIYLGSEEDFQKLGLANRGIVYVDEDSDWQTVSDETDLDSLQDNGLLDNEGYLLVNFDGTDDFEWNWLRGVTATVDTAKGVMKGDMTLGDPFIGMKQYTDQVNYRFKKGDVVQVRLKTTVTETSDMADAKSGLQFFFSNRTTKTYHAIQNRSYARNLGQWEIITIPVSDEFVGMVASDIRIDPIDNASAATLTGTYEVDYVYVGPEKKAPGNDAIYFSFDNDDLSIARYGTEIYGGFNGDIDPWSTNLKRNTELYPGDDKGTRSFAEYKDTDARYHYIRSSADGVYGYSLNHKPSIDDVLQIRVKFENFKQGNTKPYLTMTYYSREDIYDEAYTGDAGVEVSRRLYFDPAYLNNGEYVTLTLPMDASYAAREKITTFCVFLSEMVSVSKTELGVATIDYIYLGPQSGAPKSDMMTLGYDSSYENDSKLSNCSSLHVEGLGVPQLNSDYTPKPGVFTETSFTFTGTGFDIISRTGDQQGAIRAMIYDASGKYVKTVSVVNKSEKNLELYQVPVLSVENLAHGTYTVRIFVNAAYDYGNDGNADDFHGDLDRGGEFHFDAVRIYNPIDTSAQVRTENEDSKTAYSAYLNIAEADQTYTEVRNMLIDAGNYNAGGSMSGVVYLDNTDKGTTIADYKSFGPNNEVYLATGSAIAFKLVAEGIIPTSIDIGAKSADGKPANLTVSITSEKPTTLPSKQAKTITASTVQYHSLDIPAAEWNMNQDSHHVYVIIRNVDGAGILSLTDIKYAYDRTAIAEAQTRKLRFVVDTDLVEALTSGKPNEPVISEALAFSTNITAGAEMNVAYSIMASTVSEYEDFYLEVTKDVAGGEPITVTYGKDSMSVVPDPTTGEALMYAATYKGINAKEMGDSFTATLYAVASDGSMYCSAASTETIKDYLIGKFNASDATSEMKTMAIDMLKYGAAAQIYLDYDAENLVTADLTEEQLSYATKDLPEATDSYAAVGEGSKVNADITVNARVELTISTILFDIVDPLAVKCVIADEDGEVLAEPSISNLAGVMYSALYENVGAREMRKVITVTFYCGEEAVSETISWSVESYVAQVRAKDGVSAEELNMVNAMLTYGDAIAAYLTAIGQ